MESSPLVIFVVIPLSMYALVLTVILLKAKQRRRARQARKELTLAASLAPSEKDRLLAQKADEAVRLNQTIQKFVPRQFMHHLQSSDADGLELGHAVEDKVAILFCDIRGFTGMSEELQPSDLIRFLNSYFLRMNGPIHQNNGFIDKFIGDAIMALFDHPNGTDADKARDAINAAIAMQKTVILYNEHRKNCDYQPVSIGIGIHFGMVTIGTVGSDDRMDTTVIGDNVNVAARLETLSTKYSAGIIISEEVLSIAGKDFQIATRMLDFVRVKGRSKPVKIYEVLDYLPDPKKQYYLQTQRLIEQGLACRITKKWDDALEIFQAALRVTPDDPLIIHHIEMCHRCQKMALPDDWDGAMSSNA
ncbi:adenylate/guanylate cyclase domain-containing protein [Alteromonas sediminis]|uniref:Adenylate/guanylate cyclase domain-containing protein n=1 Tax=Alteromonas sediminis TaxID=2259342 RepID=A0A3N5Z6X5_9ALTE|nr:adenylate/guanylate cyclase domain-containing protein [Alteromonas sediminis]RPJ66394.1 adenylate/guanylate cyclase domain-containing protein [Alteromonas sediminis]